MLVNGRPAHPLAPNFAEWEIAIEGSGPKKGDLSAYAEDEAGNVESQPHMLTAGTR